MIMIYFLTRLHADLLAFKIPERVMLVSHCVIKNDNNYYLYIMMNYLFNIIKACSINAKRIIYN